MSEATAKAGAAERTPKIRALSGRSRDRAVVDTIGPVFGDDRRRWGVDAYKNIGWVYSAVTRIARDVSRLSWTVRRGPKDDDPELPENNELTLLLQRPNKIQSFRRWMEQLAIDLLTTGSAPTLLETLTRDKLGPIVELWQLDPLRLQAVLNTEDVISSWKYTSAAGVEKTFPFEAIAYFYFYDPEVRIGGGMSPQIPISTQLNTMYRANRWNARFFTKGARPGAIAETDEDLSEDNFQRLQKQLRESAEGEENAWNILLFDNGLKLKPWEANHKDMGFTELMRVVREEILSVNATPPGIAGDFKEATYAQVDMQNEWYWENTVKPMVGVIEDVINYSISTRVFPPTDTRMPVAFFKYRLDEIPALQEDETQKATRNQILISCGLRTPNEVRIEEGREPYPDGDNFFLSTALRPVIQALEPPQPPEQIGSPPPDSDGESDEEEDAASQERAKAKPSRLSDLRETRGVLDQDEDDGEILLKRVWSKIDDELNSAESMLRGFWRGLLRDLGSFIIKRLKEAPPIPLEKSAGEGGALPYDASWYLPDPNALVAEAVEGHGRIYQEIVARFGEKAAAEISEVVGKELTFDSEATAVLSLVERDADRIGRSTANLLNRLRETLEEGLNKGENTASMVKRIQRQVGYTRAERIVRTEAHAAVMMAKLEAFRQAGINKKKWISERDHRVREEHEVADGQVRFIDEFFRVGDWDMIAPGDPAAPPKLTVNCRCGILPVFE